MALALFSVGLLGLLVFMLGLNVSKERNSVMLTQAEAEAIPDSNLRKAIRAHGNCTEYVPMLCLMILALGLRTPILPWWLCALILAAVASRYIHALGIISGDSIYTPNKMKFIGALGTYITGAAMAIVLIIRSIALF